MRTAIRNGRIVTEDAVVEGKVLLLEDDLIKGIVKDDGDIDAETVDADGGYITPGFIDTHSDMIEPLIQPRPSTTIDFEIAIREAEKQLITQGVTTMYHSISLYTDSTFGENKVRTLPNVEKLTKIVARLNAGPHLIHHRIHLRYEIENLEALPFVQRMVDEKLIHEVSFTDHTPGQGQYSDLAEYKNTVFAYSHGKVDEPLFEKIMAHHKEKRVADFDSLCKIAKTARQNGIPVASHDDDCVEKLETNRALGVEVSEFPINLEVAKEAKKRGFFTVIGAPNLLRGKSHNGNLSAAEAIENDVADILCSDYYPSAILHAVFKMHREGVELPRMIKMVTANPAKAMRIYDERGSLTAGKKADILMINEFDGHPTVTGTMINGRFAARLVYGR
jgi:alpha-D-ribose 1-methylphosphonate 5-triphosphate diphosphatase